MEGINLNLVSHIMLLVESKYGTHLSEGERKRRREQEREREIALRVRA